MGAGAKQRRKARRAEAREKARSEKKAELFERLIKARARHLSTKAIIAEINELRAEAGLEPKEL